jgi:hypothetical protein
MTVRPNLEAKTTKGAIDPNDSRVTAVRIDARSSIDASHPGQMITDANRNYDNDS